MLNNWSLTNLGRIASCRHQAGIWTGVKSRHNTSVFLLKHAHAVTLTDTTCAWTHTHSSLSWGHSCLTAAKPHLCEHRNRNCNPSFTLSQLVPIYKVGQYCFQQRWALAYGAWQMWLTYEWNRVKLEQNFKTQNTIQVAGNKSNPKLTSMFTIFPSRPRCDTNASVSASDTDWKKNCTSHDHT